MCIDLDEDAEAALADIRESLDTPTPNFVLNTSPGKHQVVWKIEGVDTEQPKLLLRSLANRFGGDPADTDAALVAAMKKLEATVDLVNQSAPRVHQIS